MFGTILTTAVTLMHIYVFLRVGTSTFLGQRVPWKLLAVSGIILWILFYIGRFHERDLPGSLGPPFELFSMNWLATLFLCTTVLLAVDLLTGFGFLFPRLAPQIRGLGIFAGVLLSLGAMVQGLRPPVVSAYEVRLAELPAELDGTVMAVVSDTHLGSLIDGDWMTARVEQVRAIKPDLVLMLGDIFEGHGGKEEELIASMRALDAPLGVWAVLGNHEFYGGIEHSVKMFEQSGFRLLRNAWQEVRPGLVLAGVDYARRGNSGEQDISKALAGLPSGATIFLSHAPARVEQAAAAGADLMLSGHTHNGQVWPFNYLVRRMWPLIAGRYEVGDMTLIVCRGTGTWGPRMRLWRPGEILKITLRAG